MRGMRRLVLGSLGFVVLSSAVALAWAPTALAASGRIRLLSSVDGRDLSKVDANNPLRLKPNQPVRLHVEVLNQTTKTIAIHGVRLEGKVIGIPFFSYETTVALQVAPQQSAARDFQFDLIDLDHQANGLLPARVVILDDHRSVLAAVGVPVDVRGSARSLYSLFGLLVALITVALFVSALLRLVSGRLEPNRWVRGWRFGVAGLGLGFTLTFALSAFRVLMPSPGSWVPVVLVSTAALFVFGYLTPTPDRDVDEVAGEAVATQQRERTIDLDAQPLDVREQPVEPAEVQAQSALSTARRGRPVPPPP